MVLNALKFQKKIQKFWKKTLCIGPQTMKNDYEKKNPKVFVTGY